MWSGWSHVTSVILCDKEWLHVTSVSRCDKCDQMWQLSSHVTSVIIGLDIWTFGHHGNMDIMEIWTFEHNKRINKKKLFLMNIWNIVGHMGIPSEILPPCNKTDIRIRSARGGEVVASDKSGSLLHWHRRPGLCRDRAREERHGIDDGGRGGRCHAYKCLQ